MSLPIDTTLIPKPTLGQDATQYFNQLIEKIRLSKEIATENLNKARQNAKLRHDVKAQVPNFQINDLVLVIHEWRKVCLQSCQINGLAPTI